MFRVSGQVPQCCDSEARHRPVKDGKVGEEGEDDANVDAEGTGGSHENGELEIGNCKF